MEPIDNILTPIACPATVRTLREAGLEYVNVEAEFNLPGTWVPPQTARMRVTVPQLIDGLMKSADRAAAARSIGGEPTALLRMIKIQPEAKKTHGACEAA